MSTICLYGAASDRIKDKYIKEVEELGKEMAKRGHQMIYGAGASGLMGAAARGMVNNGGYIIGVTPHFMHEFEPIFDCSKIIDTSSMAERKTIMESFADAFIVVPGGIGTYDEFFQILTLKELNQANNKPIILYNIDGYFDMLEKLIRDGLEKGFIRDKVPSLYTLASTPKDALDAIETQISDNQKQ